MSVKIEPAGTKFLNRIECIREAVDAARQTVQAKLFRKQMECMAQEDFDAYQAEMVSRGNEMDEYDSETLLYFAKEIYKCLGRVDFVIANTKFNAESGGNILSFQLKEINLSGTYTLDATELNLTSIGAYARADYSDILFDDPSWGIMVYGKGNPGADESGFGGSFGDMMLMVDKLNPDRLMISDNGSDSHSYAECWSVSEAGMVLYAVTGEATAKAFRNGVEVDVVVGAVAYSDMTIEPTFVNIWWSGMSGATTNDTSISFLLFPSDSTALVEHQSALYNLYKATIGQ